jgi:transaldolase
MKRRASPDAAFVPYVTIMVGRVVDHLKRVAEAENVRAEPGTVDWAGIAVFKEAHRLFRARGLAPVLVAAAYRNERQWSELVGDRLIQSIPYTWWKAFDASDVTVARSIDAPVPAPILHELTRRFPEFVRAYDARGMEPGEFEHYGASVATLHQFESGYRALVERVAKLREGT